MEGGKAPEGAPSNWRPRSARGDQQGRGQRRAVALAGADKDTDSDSEDSADSNEDAPPSEGAGDTDFVKTTPQASRHMERILGGVVDITTPGYDGVKDVKAEVAEAKMSEKFNNVKLSVKYGVTFDDPKKFFERFEGSAGYIQLLLASTAHAGFYILEVVLQGATERASETAGRQRTAYQKATSLREGCLAW